MKAFTIFPVQYHWSYGHGQNADKQSLCICVERANYGDVDVVGEVNPDRYVLGVLVLVHKQPRGSTVLPPIGPYFQLFVFFWLTNAGSEAEKRRFGGEKGRSVMRRPEFPVSTR